jgi:hypothetical protein
VGREAGGSQRIDGAQLAHSPTIADTWVNVREGSAPRKGDQFDT